MSDREQRGLVPECVFDENNPDLYEHFLKYSGWYQRGQDRKFAMDGFTIDVFIAWISSRGGKIEYGGEA